MTKRVWGLLLAALLVFIAASASAEGGVTYTYYDNGAVKTSNFIVYDENGNLIYQDYCSYSETGRLTYEREMDYETNTETITKLDSFYRETTKSTTTKDKDGNITYYRYQEYDEKNVLRSESESYYVSGKLWKKTAWKIVNGMKGAYTVTEWENDEKTITIAKYDAGGNLLSKQREENDTVTKDGKTLDRKTVTVYDAAGSILGKKETVADYAENGNRIQRTTYYDAGNQKTGTVTGSGEETDYSASGFTVTIDQPTVALGGKIIAAYSLKGGSGKYTDITWRVLKSDDGKAYDVLPDFYNADYYKLQETNGTLSYTVSVSSDSSYYCFEMIITDAMGDKFTVRSDSVKVQAVELGQSGWVEKDGKWYYGTEAGRAWIGMLDINERGYGPADKQYFFDENGVLQTGWFQDFDGNWYYADASGKIEKDFKDYDSLYVPDYVTSMDNVRMWSVKHDFILQCTPGSAAEKFAKEHGFAYDNGSGAVTGAGMTNLKEKVKWVVDTYTTPDMSDLEKAKILHDWVIYNTIYDDDAAEAVENGTWRNYSRQTAYDAAGPLLYGYGVCDGYTRAYMMLLDQAGIENRYVHGPVFSRYFGGEGEEHAWNMVRIDGAWYHVDCTFDDRAGYEYFLANDEFMLGDHKWTSDLICGGDYAFSEGDSPQGTGWHQLSDGSWIYRGNAWPHYYEIYIGAHKIDGVMYFFDSRGRLVSGGWYSNGGNWYYIDASGSPVTGKWLWLDAWYYFLNDGRMADGWQEINGIWYYFDGGAMVTGWRDFGGVWCYFAADGAMAVGWQNIGGTWYYFDASGVMMTGWQQIAGSWYYFDASGAMATGWKQIIGTWYYFDASGAMTTGWKQIAGAWYYFAAGGPMVTGWLDLGGTWYYFDASGAMLTGWQVIAGKWEMFADSGAWLYTWQAN